MTQGVWKFRGNLFVVLTLAALCLTPVAATALTEQEVGLIQALQFELFSAREMAKLQSVQQRAQRLRRKGRRSQARALVNVATLQLQSNSILFRLQQFSDLDVFRNTAGSPFRIIPPGL
jgi:hypothetical protein